MLFYKIISPQNFIYFLWENQSIWVVPKDNECVACLLTHTHTHTCIVKVTGCREIIKHPKKSAFLLWLFKNSSMVKLGCAEANVFFIEWYLKGFSNILVAFCFICQAPYHWLFFFKTAWINLSFETWFHCIWKWIGFKEAKKKHQQLSK